MKKLLALTLVAVLLLGLLTGCVKPGAAPADTAEKPADTAEKPADTAEKPVAATAPGKVALILEGAISDMSWNATAYNGLKLIETMGAEISYQENVPVSSVADSMATYSTAGYNPVFLSSSSYNDAAIDAAAYYPDTQFILLNGNTPADNLACVQIADADQGFMLGAIAALSSTAKSIGFVGGMEITPIINGSKGFEQGAAYADSTVKVNAVLTGSFDDVSKAKETAKAMFESGADVIAPMADQAGLGVVEAAEESGKLGVAAGIGFDTVAPTALIATVIKDTAIAYKAAYEAFLAGQLTNNIMTFGVKEGVVFVEWYKNAAATDDLKAKVQTIYDDLVAGKITIDLS